MSDFRDYAGVDFSREFLAHYGKGHEDGGHSGRYPWGSGERPKQELEYDRSDSTEQKIDKQYEKYRKTAKKSKSSRKESDKGYRQIH